MSTLPLAYSCNLPRSRGKLSDHGGLRRGSVLATARVVDGQFHETWKPRLGWPSRSSKEKHGIGLMHLGHNLGDLTAQITLMWYSRWEWAEKEIRL